MKRLIVLAAMMAITGPVAAQTPLDVAPESAKKVRIDDLDLSDAGDAQRALHRLERATGKVCELKAGQLREPRRVFERSGCRRTAMDKAVASLASPTVNAIYHGRPTLMSSAR